MLILLNEIKILARLGDAPGSVWARGCGGEVDHPREVRILGVHHVVAGAAQVGGAAGRASQDAQYSNLNSTIKLFSAVERRSYIQFTTPNGNI